MENEIKVNDYVRLKDGTIAKVIEIKNQDTDILNWYCLDNNMGTMDRSIVKHSPNLIDLIQCGDYVNGILVTGKESTLLWTEIKGIDRSGYHIPISQYGENIKTVVTKEMMEFISYKV